MQERRFGSNSGGGRPGGHGGQGGREPPVMPTPRPVTYFDQAGHLNPRLVNEEAEEVAKSIKRMNSSQLRRFYDTEQADHFEREKAMFAMLKANAAYGNRRSTATVPPEFLQFVVDHVAAAKTLKEFRGFLKHFEAVVAFHRFYTEERA
jgi:CRISPR-associated protein Csm2